jgi:hypothetical protein
MEDHPDSGFSLLALVPDEDEDVGEQTSDEKEKLAQNIKFIAAVEARLAKACEEWESFIESDPDELLKGPSEKHGITQDLLEALNLTPKKLNRLNNMASSGDAFSLIDLRNKTVADQAELRSSVLGGASMASDGEEQVLDRKNDYGPLIQQWLKFLAENGELEALVAVCDSEE